MRWRVLAVVCAVSFLAYLFRYNLSVAAPALRAELDLSDASLALVLSAFIWGYALFQLPGGLLGQWLGVRRGMVVTVLAWFGITLLCGSIPGASLLGSGSLIGLLLVLRFMMGAAQGPVFPLVAGTIESWFPPSRWALPNGLSSTGATLGGALTPPLIAWLVVRFGWRQSFYLTAPLGLAAAALWWWIVRDDPAAHPGVEPSELQRIRAGRSREGGAEAGALGAVLANRELLLITASYVCMNYVWYFFFSWLYVYLVEERRFSMLEGGWMAALPWLCGAAAAAAGGEACDRLCRRRGRAGSLRGGGLPVAQLRLHQLHRGRLLAGRHLRGRPLHGRGDRVAEHRRQPRRDPRDAPDRVPVRPLRLGRSARYGLGVPPGRSGSVGSRPHRPTPGDDHRGLIRWWATPAVTPPTAAAAPRRSAGVGGRPPCPAAPSSRREAGWRGGR